MRRQGRSPEYIDAHASGQDREPSPLGPAARPAPVFAVGGDLLGPGAALREAFATPRAAMLTR